MTAFEAEWERCSPWIQAALDHAGGTHTLADVEALVRSRECRFWAGREAAVVTEIIDYPRFRAIHVWLAGGDLDELLNEMRQKIETWGRDERGCRRMTLTGRAGWERTMKPLGYAPLARTLTKELSP